MEIVLASGNPHKKEEISQIFNTSSINLINAPADFDVVEDGKTFFENALLKARHASLLTNSCALSDDTGLCIEALNGAPGLYSARYADTPKGRIQRVLDELKNIPEDKRGAYFVCSMVLTSPTGEVLCKSEGKIFGKITEKPLGVEGFGYDPIFYINELNKTMAQLTKTEKNTFSHRALAALKIKEFIMGKYENSIQKNAN